MRRVFSIKWTRREPSGPHGARRGGKRRASEPSEAQGARGVSTEPGFDSGRLGHRGEPAQRRCQSSVPDSHPGVDATVPLKCCAASEDNRGGAVRCGRDRQALLKTGVLALINFYRATLSPSIPSSCRFYPTCSAYAYEAVSQWGIRQGIWLALRRVVRCRPFGSFGYDPVPLQERS
jgi:uncharacterized protein